MKKGIDISTWQGGNIDFKKVKNSGIDFVIIRAGFGRVASQKDQWFETNYKNAKAAGLIVGAYWYSYAISVEDAKREAEACIKVINGKSFELPVFYDIEERTQFAKGKAFCSSITCAFCDKMKKNGIQSGLYISLSPLIDYITDEVQRAYPLWIAQYYNECQYSGVGKIAIWQNSDNCKIAGIDGAVDTDILYDENIINAQKDSESDKKQKATKDTGEEKKSVEAVAKEVIDGKWGNGEERKQKLILAGYDYAKVQAKVNELMKNKKSINQIAKEVIDGKWGNGEERKKKLTQARYNYKAVQDKVNQLVNDIKRGSIVKVRAGAKTYDGKPLADFVFSSKFCVMELSGDRAVIGIDSHVTAAVKVSDLILVR